MAIGNDSIGIVLFVFAILAAISNIVSIVLKLCRDFTNPKLWKYSLLYQDFAYSCLSTGLLLFFVNLYNAVTVVCDAAGFFILFGIIQCLLSYLTTGIILLSIQNPGKSSSISNFHRNVYIVIVIPQIVIGFALSVLPYLSDGLFDTNIEFDIPCFPVRDHGKQGAAYGTLLVVVWWIIIVAFVVCDVIIVLKLWKFHNRINSAQNNVWQAQLIAQGKVLVIISVFEHVVSFLTTLTTTLTLYLDVAVFKNQNTWIVMTSLALSVIVHGVVSNICNVMWTSCCCRDSSAVREPHRKLKKLELLSIETSGKLRMKATWTIGKHATKRGLMKVYGTNHLKSWAQEIVMLGMLRRIQHPSLIQCLWTNSSNPYYETMTLISGEIITSDSRIICLELTNGGTLRDFLQKVELPLPEQCQRMIVHDIAEGLFYLHHENIVHSNLTSSCVYLKGSLQSMVLRAAVGDFEEAQIYGTLQQSLDNSIKDKRHFFLPDIRSFALVALEVLTKMSEKKFQNRYVNYNSEHVPLKLNLTSVISDEDDEFEAQYSYEVEDTHRMFHAIHDDDDAFSSGESEDNFQIGKKVNGSLSNLKSPRRPMSPVYDGRDLKTPDTIFNSSESDGESTQEENLVYATIKPDISQFTFNSTHSGKHDESLRKNHEQSNVKTKKLGQIKNQKVVNNENINPSQVSVSRQVENGRCVSPDPMQDEKLQELRKETTSAKERKREKKFSFSKKKFEEEFPQKSKMEAFVKSGAEQNLKRKDGNWLNKPTSILKSITSNDTTVSVFKAKPTDEESHLDAIEEEDIFPSQRSVPRQVKVKEAKLNKSEVWDIIDEQYYTQVNKKASNKLKKTISGESRSSLWSFISTPEDLDDEDMDDILDCLPGMTDPAEFRKPEITVSDIMAERESALKREFVKKKFNFTDKSKSKFELIDYYEMLKAKQITINDVPEEKREMLLNVVELKREEKMKKYQRGNVIRSDEMYDNNMSPGSTNNNSKVKMVSFRKTQCHSPPVRNPYQEQHDPRLDRARSAPLKRPRTPMHKQPVEKPPEVNPAFNDNKSITIAKRNRARAALKRALNNKGKTTLPNAGHDRGRPNGLAVKYATVKKVATSASEAENKQETCELITVPIPTSESFSVTNTNTQTNSVKRYSSFSSNESASTLTSSERHRGGADTSLTSGEVSSLSSQAESEHYETDYHMTDTETGNKKSANGRKVIQTPSSRVDSGFDSGSISSEMSDAFTNRKLQLNTQFQVGSNKGIVDSWARNYKVVDSNSDPNITYFTNSYLPPVDSLPEKAKSCENVTTNHDKVLTENVLVTNRTRQCDISLTNSSQGRFRNVRNRKRAVPHRQKESLHITPYTSVSSRPDAPFSRSVSPPSRVISPVGRPTTPSRSMSPTSTRQYSQNRYEKAIKSGQMSRPMSPTISPTSSNTKQRPHVPRPMSPLSRPMSPNVLPTNNRAAKSNPLSPLSRALSPTMSYSSTTDSMPFSPGRKLNRPPSPQEKRTVNNTSKTNLDISQNSDTISLPESSSSKASKRYRELIKKGVPLRTSVIDANPTLLEEGRIAEVQVRPATAESMYEDQPNDQELFENLDANGFFAANPRSRSPSPTKTSNNIRGRSPVNNKAPEQKVDTRRRKQKQIPLEEIVRESPDTRRGKAHRSPSKNHLAVADEAVLNQPTSEDSETCSIKTNKSNTSTPSGSKPKMMIDAELVIDRIFSQNQPEDNELDVEVEAALGLDKDPFKAVKEMYLKQDQSETPNLNEIPLLNGVNQRHIHECIEMASSLHVLTVRDLLPASQESFVVLRSKLQQIGQLGTVGHQLLDVIHKCWLQDMPPSSGDLVEQLTDPVTETEL